MHNIISGTDFSGVLKKVVEIAASICSTTLLACVSEKHCGFIINKNHASAADVAEVICEVQERVKEKFGVTLETEVILLGDF